MKDSTGDNIGLIFFGIVIGILFTTLGFGIYGMFYGMFSPNSEFNKYNQLGEAICSENYNSTYKSYHKGILTCNQQEQEQETYDGIKIKLSEGPNEWIPSE